MKKKYHIKAILLSACFTSFFCSMYAQTVIINEDFEDNTVTYTAPQDVFHDGGSDYFHIVPLNGPGEEGIVSRGSNHFGAEDFDDGFTRPLIQNIEWLNLDVSSYGAVDISGYFAEGVTSTGAWDPDSSVRVQYSLGLGNTNYINAIAFESISASMDNQRVAQDINFDGVGNGTQLTSTFTLFSAPSIDVNSATILNVRITFENLNSGREDIAVDDFTITGTGASNSAPIATAPSEPFVLEDAVNVSIADNIEVADTDGDDQILAFTITGGTLSLGTAGITFGGSGNGSASFTAQGTLANINAALDAATFSSTSGLNGTNAATIAFTANDGQETSATASVTFDIIAVNSAPSFTIGANEMTSEDSGLQTANGFVTEIEDGDFEVVQTLTFNVSNNNNALFDIQPAIDANGNLIYSPTDNAFGIASVNVTLSDDGGTANGGTDTSQTEQFTITINQVNDTTPVVTSISLDSGVSATDFITNDNTPSVIGTAEPGSTISLIIDNPFGEGTVDTFNFGVTAITNPNGNFTIDYPSENAPVLSDGDNDFQVVSRLNGVALTSEIISGTIDTTAPTIAITSSENSPTINNSFPITITFDQEVSGFVLADIAVGNGTASNLSTSDNITYTATVTATADGDVTVDVAANVANDIAGNANEAASQFSITYTDPALSIGDNTLLPTDFSFVNPVANELVMVSSKEIISIKIYNMGGAVVASSKGNRVSTGTLSSGLYMALISTENGISTTVKMIKR